MLAVLVVLSWGSSKTIGANAEALTERLDALSATDWLLLANSLRRVGFVFPDKHTRNLEIRVEELGSHSSERLAAAIWPRLSRISHDMFYDALIRDYSGEDAHILRICQGHTLERIMSGQASWKTALPKISSTYELAGVGDFFATYRFMREVSIKQIPLEIAESILHAPDSYPADLVSVAESRLRYQQSESTVPVMKVATAQGWFRPQTSGT